MSNDSFLHLVNTSFHLLENFKMKREQRLPLDCRSSWKYDSPGLASGEKHQHSPSIRPKLKPSAQPDCDVAITFHHIKCVITVCRQVMGSDTAPRHHGAVMSALRSQSRWVHVHHEALFWHKCTVTVIIHAGMEESKPGKHVHTEHALRIWQTDLRWPLSDPSPPESTPLCHLLPVSACWTWDLPPPNRVCPKGWESLPWIGYMIRQQW